MKKVDFPGNLTSREMSLPRILIFLISWVSISWIFGYHGFIMTASANVKSTKSSKIDDSQIETAFIHSMAKFCTEH